VPVDAPAYPVNLVLRGRRVLVVGGGRVAAQKVRGLLDAEADVHVVAPAFDAELDDLADAARITRDVRPYRSGEASGYRLVVSATGDPTVDGEVYADAEAADVWVNSADDPEHCSFTLPAKARRGEVLVAVSTGGRSPALATWMRRRFEAELGPEYETLLDLLAEERETVLSEGRSSEVLDWQGALDSGMLDLIRDGRVTEAKERLQACLSSSSA
jgi:precorrin-2 dehydrogenase/sirohydrochlorin ferrochelatase